MKPGREERQRLTEEQEAELRAERARAAANDRQRVGRPQRFGWSGTTNRTRPVPCRDCGAEVQLSEYADMVVDATRDYLARIGEPPLDDGELTRCDECRLKFRARQERIAAAEEQTAREIFRRPLKPTAFDLDWLRRHGYADWADALVERWSNATFAKPRANSRQRRLGIDEGEDAR